MEKKSIWNVILCAFLIRLFCIAAGMWLDRLLYPVQFTDIDYRVYSEAAMQCFRGFSPYERQTYRYPPLLAQLMVGNILFHPAFGKILFALFDSLIIHEIYSINGGNEGCSGGSSWHWLWCFNPVSIYICSRGSVDSISNFLILTSIRLLLTNSFSMSGAVLGFATFFRTYPVIYLPSFLLYIFCKDIPSDSFKVSSIYKRVRNSWMPLAIFSVSFAVSLGVSMWVSFSQYGDAYLEHAVLYHITRQDHRHNFSAVFLGLYLQHIHPSTVDESIFPISYGWSLWLLDKIPTICQASLILLLAIKLAPRQFPQALFLQTLVFVAFNKVITGQYFLWYLVLVPIAFPSQEELWQHKVTFGVAVIAVISTLCIWLFFAYRLEFLGENVYIETWMSSLLFLAGHTVAIINLLGHVQRVHRVTS